MAWTSPKTWSISEVVTAAMLNTHLRDNLNWILPMPGAWTTFTPVLTDAGGVQNVWGSTASSRYFQSGKLVVALMDMQASAGGGNFGTGTYSISLPVTSTVGTFSGNAVLHDNSAALDYVANSIYSTTTKIYMVGSGSVIIGPTSLVPFSTLDKITVTHIYEAA